MGPWTAGEGEESEEEGLSNFLFPFFFFFCFLLGNKVNGRMFLEHHKMAWY